MQSWDAPGGQGLSLRDSNAGHMGLIPGWETKIQHILWP